MTLSAVYESLETRTHFAASALDPSYQLSFAEINGVAGSNVRVFSATPAKNGRTYLLATRQVTSEAAGKTIKARLLTILAVNAAGDLDPTFASGGVAKTGRVVEMPQLADQPGILKLDGRGRIYFATNTRVIRLRANGSIDRTFGDRGAATFATDDRPVQLCDIAPVEDGVLVATLSSKKGVQHFAVQKVNAAAPIVWEASHDSGVGYTETGKYRFVNANTAQFAQGGGQTVLARIESDNATYPNTIPDADPGDTVIGPKRQDLVVTRFDPAGHGTDLTRRELRRSGLRNNYGVPNSVVLGSQNDANTQPVAGTVSLSRDGQKVLVQTDQELLRLDLKKQSIRRSALPGPFESLAPLTNISPNYQLLPGGGIAVIIQDYAVADAQQPIVRLYRYQPDGTLDRTFGKDGQVIVRRTDFAAGDENLVDEVFLDAGGRLNLLTTGRYVGSTKNLTLRRVI